MLNFFLKGFSSGETDDISLCFMMYKYTLNFENLGIIFVLNYIKL